MTPLCVIPFGVRWLTVILVAQAACGRLAFDPRGSDGGPSYDGLVSDGLTSDAAPTDLRVHLAFEAADGFFHDAAGMRDATCTSCPTMGLGHNAIGTAATFDGTQCVHLAAPALQPATFTFAAWVRSPMMQQSSIYGRAREGATGVGNTFEVYTNAGATTFFVLAASRTSAGDAPLGVWHHVAGVFDGVSLTGYVDGTALTPATGSTAAIYSTDDIRVGCDLNTGAESNFFTGSVDDVRLYDRPLSAAEIAALAAM